MKKAEEQALEVYPKEDGLVYSTAFGKLKFDRNAEEREGYIKGYEQAEKDIIGIIETRISEIMGDAQPGPVLRIELRDLIKKIKDE